MFGRFVAVTAMVKPEETSALWTLRPHTQTKKHILVLRETLSPALRSLVRPRDPSSRRRGGSLRLFLFRTWRLVRRRKIVTAPPAPARTLSPNAQFETTRAAVAGLREEFEALWRQMRELHGQR